MTRELIITKVQAEQCRLLDEAIKQAMRESDLYTTAILNGYNITEPHSIVSIKRPKDGGYLLVIRPND